MLNIFYVPKPMPLNLYISKLNNRCFLTTYEISDFLYQFAKLLDFGTTDMEISTNIKGLIWDTSQKRLRMGGRTPCLYIDADLSEQTLIFNKLKDFLAASDLASSVAVIIYPRSDRAWRRRCHESLFRFANLNLLDLRIIVESSKPQGELIRIMKEQLGIDGLIPYKYAGEITLDSMFFGRKKEISEIIHSSENLALYGHRRAGKTSLMKKAKKHLDELGYECEYMDCRNVRTQEYFIQKLSGFYWPKGSYKTTNHNFSRVLKIIGKRYRGKVVIFLDEIDDFIKVDSEYNYSILKQLHEAALNRWCRIVVAGYRDLSDLCIGADSVFHALIKPLRISVLDDESARDLIRKPMQELGLEYADSGVIDHILRTTGRHPAFLQYYCGLLAQVVGASSLTQVSDEHLVELEKSESFCNFIEDMVLLNANAFERVIIYMMISVLKSSSRTDSIANLHKNLQALGWPIKLEELDRHIYRLRIINILERKGDEIGFSLEAIPMTLRKLDIRYRLRKDLDEVKRC